jgi:hypothetical protein
LSTFLAADCEECSSEKQAGKREFCECFDVHCIFFGYNVLYSLMERIVCSKFPSLWEDLFPLLPCII